LLLSAKRKHPSVTTSVRADHVLYAELQIELAEDAQELTALGIPDKRPAIVSD
jgi:hypothetical protein